MNEPTNHDTNSTDGNQGDRIKAVTRQVADKHIGQSHTARLMRTCLAADKMERETGIPRQQARTIMGACLDRLSQEERARLAKELEENDETREDDQT
jgi:hypothetical protein